MKEEHAMADDAAIPTQQANDEIFMTAKAAEQVRKLKVENRRPGGDAEDLIERGRDGRL